MKLSHPLLRTAVYLRYLQNILDTADKPRYVGLQQILCLLLLSFSLISFATGNPQLGQNKAIVCSACHGEHGQSINTLWPNLAGQHAAYLVQQLHHYQSGKDRSSPMMSPLVAQLSSQDIEDLAAFYAQKPLSLSKSATRPVPRGEQLYRQGDINLHIAACITCHGPDGRGAAQAGFPMISHQQPEYIIQQLQAFKAGTRRTDPLEIMRTICAKLTEKDMQELAQYIAGL